MVNLVCAGDHLLRLPPPVCPLRGGGCQTVLEGPAMVLRGYVQCIFGKGGRAVRTLQNRRFADSNNVLDLRTFRKCDTLRFADPIFFVI